MMGASHAVSGAAAWVALTSTAPIALGTHPLPPQGVLLGALVTAGAALLPDADHHSATIARSGGFLTRGLAGAAGAASGGHRHGLHTAIAAVGAALLTGFADRLTATLPLLGQVPLGSALVLLALVAFASKALDLGRPGLVNLWVGALRSRRGGLTRTGQSSGSPPVVSRSPTRWTRKPTSTACG